METVKSKITKISRSHVCRACLVDAPHMKSLHTNNCAVRFKECTSIEVNENDNLPQCICQACYDLVFKFYDFKKLCCRSDIVLRQSEACFDKDMIGVKDEINDNSIDCNNRQQSRQRGICAKTSHNTDDFMEQESIPVEVKLECDSQIDVDDMNNDSFNDQDDYEEDIRMESNNSKNNAVKGVFMCSYCPKIYKTKGCFNRHLSMHHNKFEEVNVSVPDLEENIDPFEENKNFNCLLCDEKFTTRQKLLSHKRDHPVVENVKLKIESDDSASNIDSDYVEIPDKKKFSCDDCKKSFSSQEALKEHSYSHNVKCEKCDKVYKTKKTLRNHMLTHTGSSEEVRCEQCDRTYKNEKTFKQHMQMHAKVRKHVCDVCDKGFTQKGALNLHKETHSGTKKHVCHICGAKFTLSVGLKSHILRHNSERPFGCNKCDKKFITTNELKYHKLRHDGIKRFQCPHCSFKFLFRRDLNKHIKTHSDARPYACDICGKTFKCKPFVKVHRMLHTGERKVQCDYCGRWFRNRKDIKDHIMTHSGVRPYKCGVCNQGFIQKGAYNRHVRAHNVQNEDNNVLYNNQCYFTQKKNEECMNVPGVYDSFLNL